MNEPNSREQLTGWKEIAAHLGVSTKTARNWACRHGLPVHQLPGTRGRVFADAKAIEDWKEKQERPQASKTPRWLAAYALALVVIVLLAALGLLWLQDQDIETLASVETLPGPEFPPGYWHIQAITFDGTHILTAITQDGLESRICEHNLDGALRSVGCYASPIPYVTGMTFDGPNLWTIDDYGDTFVKHGARGHNIVGVYKLPSAEGPRDFAAFGGSIWTFYLNRYIARHSNPPGEELERIQLVDEVDSAAWDGRALWTVNSRNRLLCRYLWEEPSTFVLSTRYRLQLPVPPEAKVDIRGLCFAKGQLFLAAAAGPIYRVTPPHSELGN